MPPKTLKIPLFDPLDLFDKKEIELPLPPLPFEEEEEETEKEEPKGKTEEEQVKDLLEAAHDNLERGKIERVYTYLDQVERISTCDRCIRNVKLIKERVKKGDLSEAKKRLKIVINLIPSYYRIVQEEGESLGTELDSTKKIEEECSSCNASEIIEICGWDVNCLDSVIKYIDEMKNRGEKIYATDLVRKAKEFRKVYKDL